MGVEMSYPQPPFSLLVKYDVAILSQVVYIVGIRASASEIPVTARWRVSMFIYTLETPQPLYRILLDEQHQPCAEACYY